MKNVNKLAALLSLGLVAGFVSTAALRAEATDPKSYVESYRERSNVTTPTPVKVVAPDAAFADEKSGSVEVEFVVDAKGKPTEITVVNASNEALGESVVDAVARWKFNPAVRDGVPVATKVLLPVRFTVASND